jgi:hypothetical protein
VARDRIDDLLRRLDKLESTLLQVVARLDERVNRIEDRVDAVRSSGAASKPEGRWEGIVKGVTMFVSVAAGIGVPIALAFALRGGA